MSLLLIVIAIFVWSSDMPFAWSAEAGTCLQESEISELKSEFTMTSELKWNPCDQEDVNYKLYSALLLLKHGRYEISQKSNDKIFSNDISSTNTPYSFLRKRVQKIRTLKSCDGSSQVAFVSKNTAPDTIFVCGNYSGSLADYISVAVHEARHLDAENTAHKPCRQGVLKGLDACDANIESKGAYFYDLQTKVMVGKYGKNFHPALKAYVVSSAITDLYTRFNTVPRLSGKRVTLLQERSGRLFHLDALLKLSPISENFSGRLVDNRDGSFITLNGDGESIVSMGQLHGHLGVLPEPSPMNVFITDMIASRGRGSSFGNIGSGRVLSFVFNMGMKDRRKGRVDLPFSAERFIEPNLCDGGKESHIYLKSVDNRSFEVSFKKSEIVISETQKCSLSLKKKIRLDERTLALSDDGKVIVQVGSEWQQVRELSQYQFVFMSEPFPVLDFLFFSPQKF